MKLIFCKNENDEIKVKIQKGTVADDFSYTEMVKQLLVNNSFEETDFGNLAQDEQKRITEMLKKILDVFKEEDEENSLPNNLD